MAENKWEDCLINYTQMACSIPKEGNEQKKQCEEIKDCLERGFDQPLSSRLMGALEGSFKETAGIATTIVLFCLYALK